MSRELGITSPEKLACCLRAYPAAGDELAAQVG